mmetsp:Transcript_99191/g.318240  ORF Transcript_99191/g.318240 Transcript_99191/m.318240 type:complete len:303 (+) Transcript_99191:959-1867(+)
MELMSALAANKTSKRSMDRCLASARLPTPLHDRGSHKCRAQVTTTGRGKLSLSSSDQAASSATLFGAASVCSAACSATKAWAPPSNSARTPSTSPTATARSSGATSPPKPPRSRPPPPYEGEEASRGERPPSPEPMAWYTWGSIWAPPHQPSMPWRRSGRALRHVSCRSTAGTIVVDIGRGGRRGAAGAGGQGQGEGQSRGRGPRAAADAAAGEGQGQGQGQGRAGAAGAGAQGRGEGEGEGQGQGATRATGPCPGPCTRGGGRSEGQGRGQAKGQGRETRGGGRRPGEAQEGGGVCQLRHR